MKVLVIEDSTRLQTSLGAGLRALDYSVDVVADSAQAIAYVSSRDYDIVILDLVLPKETSLLVLHEIRESNRDVEILILSAADQIHDRVTALIQGADDYLVKPFSFDELHARIQDLLRRKANQNGSADASEICKTPQSYLNGLIENLLQICASDGGGIELVISEVKLDELLARIGSGLKLAADERGIGLRLPEGRLPTLLVDAKWMEHLLSNLVFDAISRSPTGTEIGIGVQCDKDRCCIDIEGHGEEICSLPLIRSYAKYLNLEVDSSLSGNNLYRVRISNIKIV